MTYFRKESPKFDGENYLDWKKKMITHLQCVGFEIFEIATQEVVIPSLKDLAKDDATNRQKETFTNNAIAKEALINVLSDSEFSEIKKIDKAYTICKYLEDMFEGDVQAKNARKKTWKKKYNSLEMLLE